MSKPGTFANGSGTREPIRRLPRFISILVHVRLIVFTAFVMLVAGCASESAAPKTATRNVRLEKGTEVRLILLRQISAGSTREGTVVPFMVADDVTDSRGDVLIEKGTIAEGEVAWSRSEGTLSGLLNEPARLTVRLKRTRGAGGETIELVADQQRPEEAYAFNRDNTGLDEARISSTAMVQLSDSEIARKLDAAINQFFETGEVSPLNLDVEARDWLRRLGRENGMVALDESLEKGGSDLEKVMRHVRDGSITKLAGSELMLAVSAVQELGRLANSIESGLTSKLKGRTIKAYVGTRVNAFVAKDTMVATRR